MILLPIVFAVSPSILAPLVVKEGHRVGVDPLVLISLIKVESNGDQLAENPYTRARGLMQVMPDSADFIVLGWRRAMIDSIDHDRLFDPKLNVRVGAEILSRFIEVCGSLELGLSAYNNRGCKPSDFSRRVLALRERLWEYLVTHPPSGVTHPTWMMATPLSSTGASGTSSGSSISGIGRGSCGRSSLASRSFRRISSITNQSSICSPPRAACSR